MLKRLADNRNPASVAGRLRKRRFALFRSLLLRIPTPLRILDVGGTQNFWEVMGFAAGRDMEITILNLVRPVVSLPQFRGVAGDARSLEFADQSFDVVFSNSVIEHVGSYDDQRRMAAEVQRVGVRYFVQTPNRYFPIEPHFLFPAYQFFPRGLQIWLLQHLKLGWRGRVPDAQAARRSIESIRLLTKTEVTRLFPGATLYRETLAGLTKSFIVYGGWNP
jgi:hypothetical protein